MTKSADRLYLVVFGAIALIVAAAALSTYVFNVDMGASRNVSLSNLQDYGTAPGIQGTSGWVNSAPLNLSSLRGKVVLVDFWTYSCINCIRSIPHLNAWYDAYGDNGLVIIGVHTPEFQFERNYSNVVNAVSRLGIRYPVALDSDFATWDAYRNQYWPADYLVDKNGNIRYEAFGEGGYNQTEQVIRELLMNAGYTVRSNYTSVPLGVNFSQIGSPELYLGYATARSPIGNAEGFSPGNVVDYAPANVTKANEVYFDGQWLNEPDGMVAVNDSKLFLVYRAKNANIVAGIEGVKSSILTIKLDGASPTGPELGSDDVMASGQATAIISSYKLYNVVSARSYGQHLLEIDAPKGFKIYTFTFG